MACIAISAAMAPGAPIRLWIAVEVAWLRLGSSTDQVSKASDIAPTPESTLRPISSAARRLGNSRTESGR